MTCSSSSMNAFVATLLVFSFFVVLCHGNDITSVLSAENAVGNNASTLRNSDKANSKDTHHGRGTIASKVENYVKEEFAGDLREAEEKKGIAYNQSAKSEQGLMETVVRVSHKQRGNGNTTSSEAVAGNSTVSNHTSSAKAHEMESDVDRMIDSHDNEFVLSKPKELGVLTLDPVFIQDLTILYTAAACLGLVFECFGQPVINGYFVAGSIVGTGGFMLIQELVQVQSLAQLGVQLLLFYLGLEFSLAKIHAVGGVAFFGGLIEMLTFVVIMVFGCSITGADVGIGAFIGALLSLSSTSVVANCLESSKSTSSPYGQITIGTLILQDCTVGLMFATMPLIRGQQDQPANADEESSIFPLLLSLAAKLIALVGVGAFTSRTILPPLIKRANSLFSQDLFQIMLLSYCFLCALLTGWIGLSHELGAFLAGCLLSSTPQAPTAIKAIEGARNIFMTLFMASIGLMVSPTFVWEHIAILTCSVIAVLVCKASVITFVVRAFRFDSRTSLLVGLSLAQISEFAFVLLSIGVDFGLLEVEMYLLLVGVTGLSLLITPVVISISRSVLQRPHPSSKQTAADKELENGHQVLRTVNSDQVRRSSDLDLL